MAALSILPFLLILGIIIGAVVLNKRMIIKPLTFQKAKWVIVGYVSILVVATVFSALLPGFSEAKIVKDSDESFNWEDSLYQKTLHDGISSIDREDIANSWEFPVNGTSIKLFSPTDSGAFLVEKTDELHDSVEVFFLEDKEFINVISTTIDIGDFVPDLGAEMVGDTLKVIAPEVLPEINLVYSEPAFPMKQFLDNYDDTDYGSAGSRFFYVRVPKDVNVINEGNIYVEFMGG